VGWLDKAKEAAGQAAVKAKEGVDQVQTKLDLSQAYGELGKTTFALIESGELSDTRLDAPAARIRELRAKLEENADDAPATDEPPGPA
jgi:hypothetical protein